MPDLSAPISLCSSGQPHGGGIPGPILPKSLGRGGPRSDLYRGKVTLAFLMGTKRQGQSAEARRLLRGATT